MFKAFSLILIIIILSTGVFALFGDALTDPIFREDSNIWDYAFAVDQLGNVFFIRREGGVQSLIVLDSTGEQWLRTDITSYFSGHFFIDRIYILQNKSIWLTAYEYDPETLMIGGVRIAAFREDGSFVENVFSSEQSVFKDSLYRMVSSPDEDDRLVYFAGLGAGSDTVDIYAFAKEDAFEPLRKIRDFRLRLAPGVNITAMHAMPGGGLLISASDGSLTMYGTGGNEERSERDWTGRRIDRFFSGAGVVYMRDAVSGAIYSSPIGHLRPTSVISGAFTVSAERGAALRDAHDVSVSGVGNMLCVLRTEGGSELYLGGFTFLPRIATLSTSSRADMGDWFALIATIAGIIIASILIWEFFVHFMRMRMPMAVRQTLLTMLVIFIAFFMLSEYLLIPSVADSLRNSYMESLNSNADVLLSALETSVPTGSSIYDYDRFMVRFGDEYNLGGRGSSPMFAYLIVRGDEGLSLAASGGKYPPGILIGTFLPYPEIINEIFSGVGTQGRHVTLSTEIGEMIAVVKPTGITAGGAETVLCVIENLSELEGSISNFAAVVNTSLLTAGVTLTAVIVLTTIFHVVKLKKLNKGLHAIALRRYDALQEVHSGDETGEMYRHVSKLAKMFAENDESLQVLSMSYHRFVPERFLRLLGEDRVEKVSKDLQTRIEGAYVVFVRFEVSGMLISNIFENTNLVLESIVPVVARHGGTVYNLLHNGFDGVFEGSAPGAVDAALSMRDACRKFNNLNAEKSGIKVDLRVVLTKGDLTLGFMGDENRMEPTAISDTYALAAPLVRTCFGSDIYVAATKELYEEIKDEDYHMRKVGNMDVGGTESSIELFDIYDSDPPSLFENKKSFADKFEVGVSLFDKGDYSRAYNMFMDIIKHSAEDGAVRNYLYLSDYNMRNTDKQQHYTAFENDSVQKYFSGLSDAYYSNA